MYMYIFYAIYIAIVFAFIFKLSFYIYKRTKDNTNIEEENPETLLDKEKIQYMLDLTSKLPEGSPQCTAVSIHKMEDNINSLQGGDPKHNSAFLSNDSELKINYNGGWMNDPGMNDEDVELVKEYMEGAKKGHPIDEWYLGIAYYNGRGISEDRTKALKWFKKASDQGHASSQFFLGYSYYNGDNIRKNKKRGVDLLKKSALQDNWNAKQYLKEIEND